MGNRPHIVIFNPDQWRGDVMGHLGDPVAVTPNLDRAVATDAVSFRNAFCQNPVCTPSRCSFMTGWYPHTMGHRTMHHMLRAHEPMLLKTLKDSGYTVWWGGKNDLIPGQQGYEEFCDVKFDPASLGREIQPNTHGWQEWRGGPEGDNYYSFYAGKLPTEEGEVYFDGDWANVEGACEFIRNAPKDQPLCVYIPIAYPHPPYGVEDPWYSMIDRAKIPPRTPTPESWEGKPDLLERE
ncbi:MAG: sulfatase-like hydrolase/transferase, partial [Planctomycetota bacterium]